ncbi:hypothetical protein AB0I35_30730 [Nocardia sp. NPDC050378]|uniref:hypothetical protein n=1 Tax=Nocardia sp. NPDC050378 TaxID=3155400 RepID=UPI0033EB5613
MANSLRAILVTAMAAGVVLGPAATVLAAPGAELATHSDPRTQGEDAQSDSSRHMVPSGDDHLDAPDALDARPPDSQKRQKRQPPPNCTPILMTIGVC